MKVYVAGLTSTEVLNLQLTIEGRTFGALEILPMFNSYTVNETNADEFTAYMDVPFVIQAVNFGTMTVIDDSEQTVIRNIVSTTISEFQAGRNYLLRIQDNGPTTIVPSVVATVVNFLDGTKRIPNPADLSSTINAKRYHYVAVTNQLPLGMTNVNVITFDYDLNALAANEQARLARKRVQSQLLKSAI